jgi:hypothetical protein
MLRVLRSELRCQTVKCSKRNSLNLTYICLLGQPAMFYCCKRATTHGKGRAE